VGGASADLYNDATVVSLLRDGTRTVLSMQNNYKGPPEDFAMVVPVPVVLQKDQVKTLPAEIFSRLDQLAAPRLVEYWEQDPCNPYTRHRDFESVILMSSTSQSDGFGSRSSYRVKVEAKFAVAEYEIVILSAGDSTGLDAWLRDQGYKIPAGAEAVLRPYVTQGMKFFVAKVDASKVKFENGQAVLSPLRVYYDSEQFNLPVRLGMVNSQGQQDLIVHVLARAQRYEVANYDNVTVPTNLELSEAAKSEFGPFYTALFDATLERHPGAVITEYAWDASTCDPCPTPALSLDELATLGGDVVTDSGRGGFVLTRLHARYAKGALGDDLVFRAAPPIAGGREHLVDGKRLERGAVKESINNFQGRYIIRHEWSGEIACQNPQRGIWGGPPGGDQVIVQAAAELAFKPAKAGSLETYLRDDVEEIDFKTSGKDGAVRFRQSGIQPRGCAGCATSGAGGLAGLLGATLVGALLLRRRRRR
jgi:MYXO-CTERM domain-containing protein